MSASAELLVFIGRRSRAAIFPDNQAAQLGASVAAVASRSLLQRVARGIQKSEAARTESSTS